MLTPRGLRAGPALPKELVAAREQAMSDLDAVVQQMHQYSALLAENFDAEQAVPCYEIGRAHV